jgi:hypothetical protein
MDIGDRISSVMNLAECQLAYSQAKAQLDDLMKKHAEIKKEVEELSHVVVGWEAIIAHKKRQIGESMVLPPTPTTSVPQAVVPKLSVTGCIKETIYASGAAGITAPEIRKAVGDRNLKMHQNYLYVALGKLEERKQILKDGERYYKP